MTAIPDFLLLGREATRNGTRDRYVAPANNFRSGDGEWVYISAGTDALFPRFAKVAGLLTDPRFADVAARVRNVEAVEQEVSNFVAQHSADEIVRLMEQVRVPCAKVARISDVVANPQLRHGNQIVELDVPSVGKIPMHGLTVGLSGTPGSIRRPLPKIGEHTDEVLADWAGYGSDKIAALRGSGAI